MIKVGTIIYVFGHMKVKDYIISKDKELYTLAEFQATWPRADDIKFHISEINTYTDIFCNI